MDRRKPMTLSRRGFTLVELLVVVVIMGIILAILIPKFANSKDRANEAAMKSDLRNLASFQESYFYDNDTYYDGAIPDAALRFVPTRGVSIVLSGVTGAGWGATANHTGSARTCALFYGMAAAPPPATTEGEIACQ